MGKRKIIFALLTMLALTSCSSSTPHVHTFSAEWSSDDQNHWHAAICEHTEFTQGLAPHTYGSDDKCTVCGHQKPIPSSVEIGFVTNGGSSITNQRVNLGDTVVQPENPTRLGYTFDKWYEDEALTIPYDFTNIVTRGFLLYAKWNIVTYSITYHMIDGTSKGDNPDTYNVESEIVLKDPQYEGFDFDGWFLDEEHTQKITKIEKGTTGDIDLYPHFNVEYEINYVLNDGINNENNPLSYSILQDVEIFAASKIGYTFIKWHFDSITGEDVGRGWSAGTRAGDVTLVAEYSEAIDYPIIYVLPQGASHSNPSTYSIESEFSLAPATKEAYSFEGWYDNPNYTGDQVVEIKPGSVGKITLYGKFTPITYSINYERNGGSEEYPLIETYTFEDTVHLYKLTKTGYNFEGWYDNNDFLGSPISTINPGERSGDLTFYAKWSTPITYYIHYHNVAEHENPNKDKTSYNIESESYILLDAVRENYDFRGWFLDEELTKPFEIIVKGVTIGDIDLYPKFTPKKYTITYNTGGVSHSAYPCAYTVEDNIILEDPTSLPYGYNSFVGWHLKQDLSDPAFKSWNPGDHSGNLVLYAEFRLANYTIHYELNGGSDPGNPTGYNVLSKDIVLKNPTKEDCLFKGWYTTSDFQENTKITKIIKGSTGDLTLYAKFEKIWYLDSEYINSLTKDDIGLLNDVVVNGLIHKVRLIGVDEDVDANGNKIHTTWEFANLISYEEGYSLACFYNQQIGSKNHNYLNSTLRHCLTGEGEGGLHWYKKGKTNSTSDIPPVIDMIPTNLKNVLKTPAKIVNVKKDDQWVEETFYDKLFALSAKEMGLIDPDHNQEPGTKTYSYYEGHTTKIDIVRLKQQVIGVNEHTKEHTRWNVTTDSSLLTRTSYAGYAFRYGCGGGNYWTRSSLVNDFKYVNSEVYGIFDDSVQYENVYTEAYSVAPGFCL